MCPISVRGPVGPGQTHVVLGLYLARSRLSVSSGGSLHGPEALDGLASNGMEQVVRAHPISLTRECLLSGPFESTGSLRGVPPQHSASSRELGRSI